MDRQLKGPIINDLGEKLVLLSGPRQVGKTTLSKTLFHKFEYLNYDDTHHRKIISHRSWQRNVDLVIFDELHKMPKWKSWIKGLYDTEGPLPRILVTGSARLDIFKKGGDSLAGRHYHFRLHPFSVAELRQDLEAKESLTRLLQHGGFPEPFLKNNLGFSKRWRSIHLDRILKEDLLELEQVRDLKKIELLVDLLAERVGSPVSYYSLARDLEISPHTVKKWVGILEALYIIFVVTPYSKNIARSLLKEPKIYFFDTGRVKEDLGARLENVVATALLRKLHKGQDLLGEKSQLHYVRDREKREVDFLTVVDKKVIDLVEVKTTDAQLSTSLNYFKERLKPSFPAQVVLDLKREFNIKGIPILSAAPWLAEQDY